MVANDWKSSVRLALSSLRNLTLNDNAPSVDVSSQSGPYYHLVPKDPLENLAFRETLLEMADDNADYQQQLWIASSRDFLFFVNVFLWVFEPREAIILPFITWEFQDRCLLLAEQTLGKRDIGVEKSRDMGASWMFLTLFFYRWMFRSRQTFGLVSRTEDACDKRDDPDTLFWKLDFHYQHLPKWMAPPIERLRLSLKNKTNDSVITGYSAVGDVARGGRKTAFGMDEMAAWGIDQSFDAWASTQHVTNCRMAVSTPKGMAGVFAEQMLSKDAAMLKISLHWAEHPEKHRGLYRSTDEVLEVIDTDYEFPPDYPFILDGKIRSPWYDEQCRRHPIPALIAQELDIDYGGSGFPFFSPKAVDHHARLYAKDPFLVGDLMFNTDDYRPTWREQGGGPLRLWCHLTIDCEPNHNFDYVIGCDIATGSGGSQATNSVASVVNASTGEKVAEFASNDLYPHQFADTVIALRKWFKGPKGDALLIWEVNGPGAQFTKQLIKESPQRIYYRESTDVVGAKVSKSPGWRSTRDTKRRLLGEYGRAIERGDMINRSAPALDEMLHYIYDQNGSIEHDRAKSSLDPTIAGENHGDRVIADALAWLGVGEQPKQTEQDMTHDPPRGSMAWRMKVQTPAMEDAWI